MTRKEIYNRIEPLHIKMRFLYGALLYDEDSHHGEKSLSVEAVKRYSDLELESINVFLELIAASSEEIAAKDEVTFKIIREAIEHRFPELTPGFHGEDCIANGKHRGFECRCDECDYAMLCFPDYL